MVTTRLTDKVGAFRKVWRVGGRGEIGESVLEQAGAGWDSLRTYTQGFHRELSRAFSFFEKFGFAAVLAGVFIIWRFSGPTMFQNC